MGELITTRWYVVLPLAALFIAYIFYIKSLRNTLDQCAPESRLLTPWTLWLLLIPIINVLFHFEVVSGMSKTLKNEYTKRHLMKSMMTFSRSLGISMCICSICSFIPFFGLIFIIPQTILWIIYWIKIVDYSRVLKSTIKV